MVYTLVTNGTVPDEAYFNNALMKQTVIVCTSGTRPASPPEGMTIYETDTDRRLVWDGSAWQVLMQLTTTSYTVSWTGATTNPTLGNGTLTGRWGQFGPFVHVQISLTIGSTSTGGSGRWQFSLPVTPADGTVLTAIGIDVSATTRYGGSAWVTTGTGVFSVNLAAGSVGVTSTVPMTWADGDALLINGVYRIA